MNRTARVSFAVVTATCLTYVLWVGAQNVDCYVACFDGLCATECSAPGAVWVITTFTFIVLAGLRLLKIAYLGRKGGTYA